MKNLLEILEQKFDEYHAKQLEIDNDQNPDYYLFMGKASAIGDLIDEIKSDDSVILQDKIEEKCSHKESYFVYENNRKMHYERCCSCGSFLRESKDGNKYIEFTNL